MIKPYQKKDWYNMFKDLSGQKFGKLTATKPNGKTLSGNTIWLCMCECGKYKDVINTDLTRGRVKSCGCIRSIINKHKDTDKDYKLIKFKTAYRHMKERIFGDRQFDAQYYKGRVSMCEKWLNFDGFYEDMYESFIKHCNEYGLKQTTLDRKDNDGNYCKENCKWATLQEQVENRRNQKKFKAISPSGEVYFSNNQRKFAREQNISFVGINACINSRAKTCMGWKFEVIV